MPAVRTFEIAVPSSAPPEMLFDLLSDAPKWPQWFRAVRHVDWVRPSGPDGAGAVRRVTIGPVSIDETILADERPHHHAYRILTVIPVRHHRADVWFAPDGCGTRIRWVTEFLPTVPGTGTIIAGGLRFGIRRLARALTTAAEERYASGHH